MEWIKQTLIWLNPGRQLFIAACISLLSSLVAFRSTEIETQTLITFVAFYVILALMWVLFSIREKLSDPKTRQLLQFSYIMLGFVLSLTGVLGIFNGGAGMIAVFLLMLLLPGLALIRCGLNFNRNHEKAHQ
jgi:uncharacterized membrane protein YfcA